MKWCTSVETSLFWGETPSLRPMQTRHWPGVGVRPVSGKGEAEHWAHAGGRPHPKLPGRARFSLEIVDTLSLAHASLACHFPTPVRSRRSWTLPHLRSPSQSHTRHQGVGDLCLGASVYLRPLASAGNTRALAEPCVSGVCPWSAEPRAFAAAPRNVLLTPSGQRSASRGARDRRPQGRPSGGSFNQ